MKRFWKYFLTGLIIVLPGFITLAILQLIFGWIFRLFIKPVARLVYLIFPPGLETLVLVHLLITAGFVAVISLIGFGAQVLVIRRFVDLGEAVVRRVPMVGKIYGTCREIANTLTGNRRGLFNYVVLLEWPRAGMYSIGFVTSEGRGEVQEKTPEHVVNVFIPTTPNPTSGYLALVPRESLIRLEMSVEDAMRLIISGGISGPEVKLPSR